LVATIFSSYFSGKDRKKKAEIEIRDTGREEEKKSQWDDRSCAPGPAVLLFCQEP
jgi:hypothetical protein